MASYDTCNEYLCDAAQEWDMIQSALDGLIIKLPLEPNKCSLHNAMTRICKRTGDYYVVRNNLVGAKQERFLLLAILAYTYGTILQRTYASSQRRKIAICFDMMFIGHTLNRRVVGLLEDTIYDPRVLNNVLSREYATPQNVYFTSSEIFSAIYGLNARGDQAIQQKWADSNTSYIALAKTVDVLLYDERQSNAMRYFDYRISTEVREKVYNKTYVKTEFEPTLHDWIKWIHCSLRYTQMAQIKNSPAPSVYIEPSYKRTIKKSLDSFFSPKDQPTNIVAACYESLSNDRSYDNYYESDEYYYTLINLNQLIDHTLNLRCVWVDNLKYVEDLCKHRTNAGILTVKKSELPKTKLKAVDRYHFETLVAHADTESCYFSQKANVQGVFNAMDNYTRYCFSPDLTNVMRNDLASLFDCRQFATFQPHLAYEERVNF